MPIKKKIKEHVVFRNWTRKNNGAFLTIGKQVAIATMALAFSIPFTTKTIQAQTDTASFSNQTDIELDEIIVNPEAEPVEPSKTARIITIITKKEIDQSTVVSFNELLEYALNTDIRQRGIHGVQADLSIRGGTSDQTLILLNGMNITDPQSGHHSLNLPLNLASIERIEILSGPAALAFGVNAFSGAINIITSPVGTNRVDTELFGGQNGLFGTNTSININNKWLRNFITVSHTESDGYLENTDFYESTAFYHGQFKSSTGDYNLQMGYATKGFGANNFYTPKYPKQYEHISNHFLSIDHQFSNSRSRVKTSVYSRIHNDRFELFRDTAPDWYTSHNYHKTLVSGAQISLFVKPGFGYFMLNYGVRYNQILSNVLGNVMKDSVKVKKQNAWYTRQASKTHHSLTCSYGFDFRKIHAIAGIMYAMYMETKNHGYYPGIEASYNLFNGLRAYGSYNSALRTPTFTELYYKGPTNTGSTNLEPEKSTTIEGGLKYINDIISIQAGYYHRIGKHIIDWVKPSNAPDDRWKTTNLTDITSDGVDIACKIAVPIKAPGFYLNWLKINYAYNNLSKSTEANLISKYVLDNLNHKLSIQFLTKLFNNLYSTISIVYQDRNGSYLKHTEHEVYEKPFNPFWLTNLRISYRQNNYEIYSRISNVFNVGYVDFGNIEQPGRWISAGFKYKPRIN